jgi:hypothetical protein
MARFVLKQHLDYDRSYFKSSQERMDVSSLRVTYLVISTKRDSIRVTVFAS